MDISLILKVAGTGIIVSIICQILNKSGREDMSMLVTISGFVIVLSILIGEFSNLLTTVKKVFGI